MFSKTIRCMAVAGFAATLVSAQAVNILTNPGFETGDLTGWTTTGFAATNNDFHTGLFCALDEGNFDLTQTFAPVAASSVTEVSLWVKQPNVGSTIFNAVDLIYSDSTFDEFVTSPSNTGGWVQENLTSLLNPGKSLSGIRAWGYSQNGSTDFTSYDDFVVNVAAPEPATTAALSIGLLGLLRKRRPRK